LSSFRICAGHLAKRRWLCVIFILSLLFGGLPTVEAQRRLAPRPIPYSELDRREGEQRLSEMREMGIPGVYTFVFELRVMPRRGAERSFRGQLWGSRNRFGPIYRYEIWESGQGQDQALRFLAQNGETPSLWVFDAAAPDPEVWRLGQEDLFTPIKGTDFVPFDLQMPFLYWEDFAYEGLRRVRGRSSHGFLMYAPDEISEAFPWLEGVRMFLDAEFNALTGAEVVDARGQTLRSFNIIEIKRVGEQWIVKSVDYRNARSGDRTRLSIGGAALDLPPRTFPFKPEALSERFPELPRDRFDYF
jgi:hypothetical protein